MRGFTLVEVVVCTALILLFSLMVVPMVDLTAQREREEDLRRALLEMRGALDVYHQHTGALPGSMGALITTMRTGGGFYLRRLPLNALIASRAWQIASSTSLTETVTYWHTIHTAADELPDGTGILDIRSPAIGTGINGIPYKDW
jgi:general secretion pathway protein G